MAVVRATSTSLLNRLERQRSCKIRFKKVQVSKRERAPIQTTAVDQSSWGSSDQRGDAIVCGLGERFSCQSRQLTAAGGTGWPGVVRRTQVCCGRDTRFASANSENTWARSWRCCDSAPDKRTRELQACNFAELSLLQLILCGDAVYQTAIKHGPRVAQDPLECGSIGLANRFGIISSLPRSPTTISFWRQNTYMILPFQQPPLKK